MIDTKELRIGNLVQRPEHLRIDILDGYYKYFKVNVTMIMDCERLKGDWAFEPIPLTEDWLVRFGFKKATENNGTMPCFKYGKLTITRWGIDKYKFWTVSGEIYNSFQFVHQLQNIFFSLTGKELEVK